MTVRTHSLADRVASNLREQILSGSIKPDERLRGQNEMALEFGVSVVVVREALSRLKADGLVRSRQGSGVFAVSNPEGARSFKVAGADTLSPTTMTEVLEIRLVLETTAADLAARRHKPIEIRACEAAFKKLKLNFQKGSPSIDADFEFHMAIAKASGNQLFPQLLDYLHTVLLGTMHSTHQHTVRSQAKLSQVHDEHTEIMEAIRDGDGKRAQRVMKRHLDHAAGRLGLKLNERG